MESLQALEKAYRNALKALPPSQKIFVEAYVATKNGSKSAITAGYSEKSSRSAGSELLTKPNVQSAISLGIDFMLAKYNSSPERIIAELESIAFGTVDGVSYIAEDGLPRMKNYDEIKSGDSRALAAISGVETVIDKRGNPVGVKFTRESKIQALKLLAEIYKLKADMDEKVVRIKIEAPEGFDVDVSDEGGTDHENGPAG